MPLMTGLLLRKKYLRSNHTPFMNKDISKAIMNQIRLRNRFLKSRPFEDRATYNKQRNYCTSLVRKTKMDYYNNVDHKKVADNKSFWKYIRPHFTDKSSSFNTITFS